MEEGRERHGDPHGTRVLHVIARLNRGGPARVLGPILARLREMGLEVRLAHGRVAAGEEDVSREVASAGIPLHYIPSLGREIRPAADLRAYRALRRLIRRFRPDVVQTHTSKAGFLGRLAARAEGVPVVLHTFRGHVLEGYFDPLRNLLFRSLERWLARRTDRILVVSPSLAGELSDRLGVGRHDAYVSLPPYVPPLADPDGAEEPWPLPAGCPTVGIVGRLVPIKNHRLFLRAAALVARRDPRVRFAVVGDGPLRPRLERLAAEAGLKEKVHFLGWRRGMRRVYDRLDVLVLTSDNEGLPYALLEAMSMGLPVVATRVGGIPDVLEDGVQGFLVPRGDAEAVGSAILRILEDGELARRMGQRGRERVREMQDPGPQARALRDLYAALLREAAGPGPRRRRA
jgi:glycosyltransferase involved in cell wall biosynthesis